MFLEVFERFELSLCELSIYVNALLDHLDFARNNDFLVDVLYEGLDERCTDALDALFEPDVIVEELSLACQDAHLDCEVVVRAVDNFEETVFDLLRDVQDSVQVQHLMIWCADLADASDHQRLVVLPQPLQHDHRVRMRTYEHRHENGQELVDEDAAIADAALAQSQQQVLWHALEWSVKDFSDSWVWVAVRQPEQALDHFRLRPDIDGLKSHLGKEDFGDLRDLASALGE